MRTLRLTATLIALALLLWPAPAAAHASLVRSDPPAGAMLSETPPALVLEFNEQLDPALSRVQLFDAANRQVAETSAVDPASPLTLRLPLGVLRDGPYTAIWRVRSAVDGHITEGSVPFGVGVPAAAPATLPPPGVAGPAAAPPELAAVLARYLTLSGLALVVGALGFGRLIWRPVAVAGPADTALGAGLRRLGLAGLAAVMLAALAELAVQAAEAGGPAGPWSTLPALLSGRTGILLGARLVLAGVIVGLALRLPPPAAGPAQPWELGLVLSGPLLLTLSLAGHAGAAGAPALAAAWAHAAAMALWLGGLPPLLLAVGVTRREGGGPALGALLGRFSALSLAAVAVLIGSGAVAALTHIDAPQRLLDTSYGRALLVKSGLFLALLGLGALHLLVVRPRIRAGGAWAGRIRRTLAIELAAAAGVLLATAALTSSPPASAAWAAQQQLGARAAATAGDVEMVLWVAPAVAGENVLALDLRDPRLGAPPSAVLVRMQMPGMQMGVIEEALAPEADGRYQLRGSHLTMVGRWEIEAIVRRPGLDDMRHSFSVDVRGPAADTLVPEAPAHQHSHTP